MRKTDTPSTKTLARSVLRDPGAPIADKWTSILTLEPLVAPDRLEVLLRRFLADLPAGTQAAIVTDARKKLAEISAAANRRRQAKALLRKLQSEEKS
jgi:hypothetical protein